MPNITLEKPLDEHLKPLKGNGVTLPIEVSTNGVRVKNLDGEIINTNEDDSKISIKANSVISKGSNGIEYSSSNSAYAGMILGYTDIGLNESLQAYAITAAYTTPSDEFSVAFISPPSGNVSIEMQIQLDAGSTGVGDLYASLSTTNRTDDYTALASYHEKEFFDVGARGGYHTARCMWTLTGLTSGASYEYWAAFKSSSTGGTPTVRYGGNATGTAPDFIMKATALPSTITT